MRYLILGQGKSGTTALFRAIESQVPAPVKTVFEPKNLGKLRGGQQATSFVAKVLIEHVTPKTVNQLSGFDYSMFICRDPRDVMISRLLYRVRGMDFIHNPKQRESFLDLLRQKERDPLSIPTVEIFSALSDLSGTPNQLGFLKRAHDWAVDLWHNVKDAFILSRYEDFVSGNTLTLSANLGFPIENRDVGPDLQRVVRTKSFGDWKHWFTEEDSDWARQSFAGYLDAFGYTDWTQPENRSIPSVHASKYVERIIGEQLAMQA